MPLADLSLVTSSLRTLMDLNIRRLMGGVPPGAISITTLPPEKVGAAVNTLNLHLYHIAEDRYYKNMPGPGNDARNIARAPMALALFYILTAHHEQNPDIDALTQQRLMGLALKTMHDYPIVVDRLMIDAGAGAGAQPVLDPALQGNDNPLQIILRPLTPEDTLAFWSTDDQQTARLSAYYEVRVVMLAPEAPERFPGVVLSIGEYVRALGAAALAGSRSTVHFTVPAAIGGGAQAVTVEPARVQLDPGSAPPHDAVTLLGSKLTSGIEQRLVLRNAAWSRLIAPVNRVELDPAMNPGWEINLAADRIEFRVQPNLAFLDGGVPRIIDVLPGIYSASVRTVIGDRVFAGERMTSGVESNQIAFAIGPRIAGHGPPDPVTRRVRIDIVAAFDLSLPSTAVELVVQGDAYVRLVAFTGNPAVDDGAFVVDAAGLVLQPLFNPLAPGFHAVRLMANGAEAQPFWIEI
jgi:Pvc16 N-terminal domain